MRLWKDSKYFYKHKMLENLLDDERSKIESFHACRGEYSKLRGADPATNIYGFFGLETRVTVVKI